MVSIVLGAVLLSTVVQLLLSVLKRVFTRCTNLHKIRITFYYLRFCDDRVDRRLYLYLIYIYTYYLQL